MLEGVHFLLTYTCNFECDHCFVYSSPSAKGTFSLQQIKAVLQEAKKIGVEWIYFEGGEPFLFYPLMVEGIRIASSMGFKVGVVTNAYWATTAEDAKLWLAPFHNLVSDISISDNSFHYPEKEEGEKSENGENLAKNSYAAARSLNMSVSSICIDKPDVKSVIKGETSLRFRGRAADKLTDLVQNLPRRNWREFRECPYENLEKPERVHVDSFGNVHICQGLLMGNLNKTPLSELIKNYDFNKHPICEPLVKGGPALLAEKYEVKHEASFIDACHFCFSVRRLLIDRFPECLGPRQVYGLE